MRRHLTVLAVAAVLAAGEILALPASAETPMSPVYPTVSRPKRVTAVQPTIAAAPSTAEKPSPAVALSDAKEGAPAPAKNAAAEPVFEAAIPPPLTVPDNQPPPSPAAEAPPPPAKKSAARPRQPRLARAPRYAYRPYAYYRVAPFPAGYADPQRGWGGGRYGPTPISDGQ